MARDALEQRAQLGDEHRHYLPHRGRLDERLHLERGHGVALHQDDEEGGADGVRAEGIADVRARLVQRHDRLHVHLDLVGEAAAQLGQQLHQPVVEGDHTGIAVARGLREAGQLARAPLAAGGA